MKLYRVILDRYDMFRKLSIYLLIDWSLLAPVATLYVITILKI